MVLVYVFGVVWIGGFGSVYFGSVLVLWNE